MDFPRARILIFGNDELLRSRLAAALADRGYAPMQANLTGEVAGAERDRRSTDLPIHLMIVLASDDPIEALDLMKELRAENRDTPIIAVANEAAYFDLWPHTAELEIAACFSERCDSERFVTMIEALLAPSDG